MSPLRLLGSLLASPLHRICGQAAWSARLSDHRLPHGCHRATGATSGTALSAATLVGVRGMSLYNFKSDDDDDGSGDNTDKSVVARKPTYRHQGVLDEEDETAEERAMKKRFEEWMIEYGRTYKDEEEKATRYEIFRRTARFVDEHNARHGRSWTCGTNDFADRTKKELSWLCGGACLPEDELARFQHKQDRR